MKSTSEMLQVYERILRDVGEITQQEINDAAFGVGPMPYWNVGGSNYEIRINHRTIEVLKNGNSCYSPYLTDALARFVFKPLTVDLVLALAAQLRILDRRCL